MSHRSRMGLAAQEAHPADAALLSIYGNQTTLNSMATGGQNTSTLLPVVNTLPLHPTGSGSKRHRTHSTASWTTTNSRRHCLPARRSTMLCVAPSDEDSCTPSYSHTSFPPFQGCKFSSGSINVSPFFWRVASIFTTFETSSTPTMVNILIRIMIKVLSVFCLTRASLLNLFRCNWQRNKSSKNATVSRLSDTYLHYISHG